MGDLRYLGLFDPLRSQEDFSGSDDGESPPSNVTVWLFRWRITEAALGVLIHVGRPMSIGQILADLESRGVRLAKADPPKALSDVLRYQARTGRVRKVGRGRYEIRHVSRTTAWRYRTRLIRRNWEDTAWELTDSRPSYDVPAPSDPAQAAGAESEPSGMRAERPDIRQIAMEWALRSGLWPSDS